MKHILVADDDAAVRNLIARALPEYRITMAHNGAEALVLALGLADCDLLITDYLMPEMIGDEVVGRVREKRPALKTLMVTGHHAFADIAACGPDAHLPKPVTVSSLRNAVSQLIGID